MSIRDYIDQSKTVPCNQCNKIFELKDVRAVSYGEYDFCSKECEEKYWSIPHKHWDEDIEEEKFCDEQFAETTANKPTEKKCDTCRRLFVWNSPNAISKGINDFCSKRCADTYDFSKDNDYENYPLANDEQEEQP